MTRHQVLNDIEGLENPTAELIAAWFLERVGSCESVELHVRFPRAQSLFRH